MPHVHPVAPSTALSGPELRRDDNKVTLIRVNDDGLALGPWPLLCQYQLASGKVFSLLTKADDGLHREVHFSVQVLM